MRKRITPGVRLSVGLVFLAPLVGEFLLGNLPIILLPAVFALAPLYGGGALLIREVVRRRGLGWPNMVILALAFAVVEEGLTTQSLFNPNYADEHLLVDGFIPALGIAVPWTIYVLGIHVFWSISASIMMMEVIAGERRTTPWLGRTGLIVTGALFLLGAAISTAITMSEWPYTATAGQFTATGIIIALLVAAGLLLRITFRPRPGVAPSARVVLIATLVAGAFFQGPTLDLVNLPVGAGVALWAVDIVVYLTLLARWSAKQGWSDLHRLAIGAGALLTYAWHSFAQSPVGAAAVAVDLIGNTVFSAGAVALIWYAYRSVTARAAVADMGVRDDRSVG
ncbi:hypothetical protein GCM10010168_50930 [Actinoplanes ianthinogenes]|uniref:Uncharacterized protein n=1 Tax=Actinoplanes ianthinogenes TaxID=122358 RepID=A0ABN6CM99_9ACTN|nr:hypothetical protein [Actinoplanes ianthinogenes]BCJ46144.1 hypothetical protein Aiant_68010 [Actinoplanes ianthinogenes]GGR26564.1 hypothetical protein GCM10010168_50930 [Actinoplanes ianthinogenes]